MAIFQSPFHRGKDCNRQATEFERIWIDFQSPFHRGKDCNALPCALTQYPDDTFSPLFIGARIVTGNTWTLASDVPTFQSPFHRGKDCNVMPALAFFDGSCVFQSPFHRGKDCNKNNVEIGIVLINTFSPLFIGARIVTDIIRTDTDFTVPFSPLFIGARIVTPIQRSLSTG